MLQLPSVSETEWIRSLVLHIDDDLIVLNKPYGLSVQGGSSVQRSLVDLLPALQLDAEHLPRLVHRLDKHTTGALVIARTLLAAREVSAVLGGRHPAGPMHKRYWALVSNPVNPPASVLHVPLMKKRAGRFEHERTVVAPVGDASAWPATTSYETVCSDVESGKTWLELSPSTGRKHQLRAHCSEVLRSPIVGDTKYGSRPPEGRSELHSCMKLHLHCAAIDIPVLPSMGMNHRLQIRVPLPKHMEETWVSLSFPTEPQAG